MSDQALDAVIENNAQKESAPPPPPTADVEEAPLADLDKIGSFMVIDDEPEYITYRHPQAGEIRFGYRYPTPAERVMCGMSTMPLTEDLIIKGEIDAPIQDETKVVSKETEAAAKELNASEVIDELLSRDIKKFDYKVRYLVRSCVVTHALTDEIVQNWSKDKTGVGVDILLTLFNAISGEFKAGSPASDFPANDTTPEQQD